MSRSKAMRRRCNVTIDSSHRTTDEYGVSMEDEHATVWKACSEVSERSDAEAKTRQAQEREERQTGDQSKTSHRDWLVRSTTPRGQSSSQESFLTGTSRRAEWIVF